MISVSLAAASIVILPDDVVMFTAELPADMLSAGVKPRTFDDLNDAEKARYTDLLLKRQALEAMLTARIFPFELDATK